MKQTHWFFQIRSYLEPPRVYKPSICVESHSQHYRSYFCLPVTLLNFTFSMFPLLDIFRHKRWSPACAASLIRNPPSTTAHDKHEHKRARILPLGANHQVPPVATPPPDKPEEPPPAPHADTAPSSLNSKLVQATQPIGLDPARAPHLPDDACTHFSGKTPSFASPADGLSGRHHQQRVDPGGSNFEPPGRCKVCIRASLIVEHFSTSPTFPTTSPDTSNATGHKHTSIPHKDAAALPFCINLCSSLLRTRRSLECK